MHSIINILKLYGKEEWQICVDKNDENGNTIGAQGERNRNENE